MLSVAGEVLVKPIKAVFYVGMSLPHSSTFSVGGISAGVHLSCGLDSL